MKIFGLDKKFFKFQLACNWSPNPPYTEEKFAKCKCKSCSQMRFENELKAYYERKIYRRSDIV
jgi:hypothetical protein